MAFGRFSKRDRFQSAKGPGDGKVQTLKNRSDLQMKKKLRRRNCRRSGPGLFRELRGLIFYFEREVSGKMALFAGSGLVRVRRVASCMIALFALLNGGVSWAQSPGQSAAEHAIVLHAARLLDVKSGRMVEPGEVLVQGERIVEVGAKVKRPAGVEVIDLGDRTLLPGLIDAHVHLFLHPGAEDLQTVKESVPQRTITATLAARDDLMAGFTAERDMGTEGAGSADTAVRNAIDEGRIPWPRLRISGNAVDILGGHEDAIDFNPEQHIFSNATYANNATELVKVIRQQVKEGADFIKIYQTGPDTVRNGKLAADYLYTEAELSAAVQEAARTGRRVAVHAMTEPGTLYAAQAGVATIDHANQLGEETMRLMREKQIYAVPTFTIFEYFTEQKAKSTSDPSDPGLLRMRETIDLHAQEFHKQLAAGVPMAVGSDVGPFPHGTQAREFVLMAKYGMAPAAVLQADLLNGAKLLGWDGQIGSLEPGYFADVIAVAGDPLQDIGVLGKVSFVMKGGVIYKK
jgi:imidazolonepropionase-like amidohydrolase